MVDEQVLERARQEEWADEQLVQRVLNGDVFLFELLMRRHNQRVYRAARSILRDDSESEDVMQETYLRAYQHLAQFEGRARFSTWLTRIAVNESIRRAAFSGRYEPLSEDGHEGEDELTPGIQKSSPTPESDLSRTEMTSILEKAILTLPERYRLVVMLRDVEEMSTAETAEALSLSEANVKVRLHRAHELLRNELFAIAGSASRNAFGFGASRCDRVVQAVLGQIAELRPS
jgi:RNA polymerase sigma-70 factor (ECF subfamily)